MSKGIKYHYLTSTLIIILIFFAGCYGPIIIPGASSPPDGMGGDSIGGPTSGIIIIAGGAEVTNDCTPSLTIFSEEAIEMSFSGDGENWTEWLGYDTYYEGFNIANGVNGSTFGSGIKHVYVRFRDEEGRLSPPDKLAFDTIEYEMGELYSIKISPQKVTIPVGGSRAFTIHGYDLMLNEVPLESLKVTWTKICGVGNLFPTIGLSTTYTAPSVVGQRNITAYYNNLQTGAVIIVTRSD